MSKIQTTPTQIIAAAGRRRAFTLIEMLVAVGAVALLTAGVAQVFRVTSKTVSSGRKISNLISYGNLIERRLREDLGKLSRQGFIVVRNEEILAAQAYPGDRYVRPRRIDELQFFVEGRYQSAHDPNHPDLIATASAARVYYGHGLRQDPNNPLSQQQVRLDDPNLSPYFGEAGPNQFAADWILARHVTLLAQPKAAQKYLSDPATPGGPSLAEGTANVNELDSITQIARQPAAPSIFRTMSGSAAALTGGFTTLRSGDPGGLLPGFACGAVDIAATDISTIRQLVISGDGIGTAQAGGVHAYDRPITPEIGLSDTGDPSAVPTAIDKLFNIQSWMRDSLPADSDQKFRIRVEPTPPNPLGVGWATPPTDSQRSDQIMLSNSVLAPNCTEFIVEWSFGETGQSFGGGTGVPDSSRIRWYGLPRQVNNDSTGTFVYAVEPYDMDYLRGLQTSFTFYPKTPFFGPGAAPLAIQHVPPYYEFSPGMQSAAGRNVLYNYFGYMDPFWPPQGALRKPPAVANAAAPTTPLMMYDPNDPNLIPQGFDGVDLQFTGIGIPGAQVPVIALDKNNNGIYEPQQGDVLNFPETLPWKWPKLLRVTVTLADPIDPTVERTFQYVFKLPDGPQPKF